MTGLDPRLVLAQAAIETGYGRSAPNFNFFGIKAPQGQGENLLTSEFENGQMVRRSEPFRTYGSPEESFTDYARFVTENPRYRPVLEAETLADQIAAMGASGYATDPNYGNLLSQVAGAINLDSPEMIASDTMAALGRGETMDGLLGTPPAGNQPRSGTFQAQQPQQRQPFFGPDFRDRLTLALGGLSMRPNTALMQMAQNNIQQRRQEQQTMQQRNATAEYIRNQGRGDLADLVMQGVLTGAQAIQMMQPDDVSAKEQQIQRLMETGVDRNTAIGIVDGLLTISRNPETGVAEVINVSTGQRVSTPSVVEEEGTTVAPSDTFDDANVTGALGARGLGAQAINVITDALGMGQAFPNIGEAQQELSNLSTRTMLDLAAEFPGRPSNLTRERIEEMTIKPGELSTGADAALNKASQLRRMIEQAYNAAEAAASADSQFTPAQRTQARQRLPALQALLADYIALERALQSGNGGAAIRPEVSQRLDAYQ